MQHNGYKSVSGFNIQHDKTKKMMKRTDIFLSTLHKWVIVAFVLLIIILSIFFFLNNKVNISEEIDYVKNHVDKKLISKYSEDSTQTKVKSSKSIYDMSISGNNTNVGKKESGDNILKQNNSLFESSEIIAQMEDWTKPDNYQNSSVYKDLYLYGDINEYQGNEIQSSNTISTEEIQILFSQYDEKKISEELMTDNNINQTVKPVADNVADNKAFSVYVNKNRKQLTDSGCEDVHGKVILLFKVNNTGRPVDIAILRSLCKAADNEAIRLLRDGPNWTTSNNFVQTEISF